MKRACVFCCGSNVGAVPGYRRAGARLGILLAKRELGLVDGAG